MLIEIQIASHNSTNTNSIFDLGFLSFGIRLRFRPVAVEGDRFKLLQINIKPFFQNAIVPGGFLLYTVRSKSNCAPAILKQERYPVF